MNYKHYRIPIEAPGHVWAAAGYTLYTNSDVIGVGNSVHGMDDLVVLGTLHHPDSGEKAILWAIAERQRRKEETTRSTAMAREAEALSALARAIEGCSEKDLISKILSRVSDKTRIIVMKQLEACSCP